MTKKYTKSKVLRALYQYTYEYEERNFKCASIPVDFGLGKKNNGSNLDRFSFCEMIIEYGVF